MRKSTEFELTLSFISVGGYKIGGVFPVYAVVLLTMYILITLLFLLSDYKKKPALHFVSCTLNITQIYQ